MAILRRGALIDDGLRLALAAKAFQHTAAYEGSIAVHLGAAVKLCGSGGAVVGAPADAGKLGEIERAYRSAGYRMIRPEVHS